MSFYVFSLCVVAVCATSFVPVEMPSWTCDVEFLDRHSERSGVVCRAGT